MRRARPLLGTIVEIDAQGDRAAVARAIDQALLAVEKIGVLMSFHDRDSDLSRINRRAHRESVEVHPWTWQVLRAASRLHRLTGGVFDCAIAPELVRRRRLPPLDGADPRNAQGGTFADVVLERNCTVRFNRPLLVDLGGIAKGYAVDQAVRVMKRAGIASAIVNAGGDLRAFGPEPRRVHVRHPRNPRAAGLIGELRNAALATSAAYFSPTPEIAPQENAIIDPRVGRPAPFPGSVSVVAPTCMVADALTKVVAIAGTAKGCGLSRWRARAILL